MKKVLFISNISNKITNFAIPSIKAAQKLGYEFHMAANFSNFNDDETKYNVLLHHIDLDRNPFSLNNIKAYKQMISLMKNERFDVIHCNTPIGGILGRLCGKKANVPNIIYTAHGFHFYKGAPLTNNIIFKTVEKWLAHYTNAIITMNEEDFQAAKDLTLRNGGKAYYIPGVGVDTKEYNLKDIDKKQVKESLSLKEADIVLIAMGDLIKRKNYDTSIKAIAKVGNPNLHFLICGKGKKLYQLMKLAKRLGVENQVHFLGFRTDIKKLLSISDIFLFSTYQEGLPRSMMEAMASGLPCVASKIRGNTDLLKDGTGGFLLNPDDINGFSKAIENLSADKDLRKTMGLNNLKTIMKFDVENVKLEMEKIYQKEFR